MSYKTTTRRYVLIALVISLGFSIYTATRPSHDYPTNKPGGEVLIVISDGEFGTEIAKDLQSKGVIKEAATFVALANQSRSGANGISAGSHMIQRHISSIQAIEELLDRKRFTNMINIVEGSTLSDVLKLLSKNSDIVKSSSSLVAAIHPFISNSKNSIEGQLFPASYTFAPKTTTVSALKTMMANFATKSAQLGLSSGYKKYSAYQVLTVASMVQIEGDPSDYAKVAGVIYNRLRIGMPLQLNSTVQYAAGLRGQIALSTAATKIDSLYNTYKYTGLPPTPISSAGELAIRAALNPAVHDFLYFITVKPHDTRFTKEYTQFQDWVTEYNKNRAAGAFK